MDVSRLFATLDKDFAKNDYDGALRHLLFWKQETVAAQDDKNTLTVNNELVGLYRKLGKKNEALQAADEALTLLEKTQTTDTVSAATVFINVATAYKAFGKAKDALPLFDKAKNLYEKYLDKSDEKYGALYNNMGLAYADIGDYHSAEDCFTTALTFVGKAEMAITYLNMADLALQKYDVEHTESLDDLAKAGEEISLLCDNAWNCLCDTSLVRDGYYAFVCEKCAAAFGYHGQYERQNALKDIAEKIYAE